MSENSSTTILDNSEVGHVIILVHGIRTDAPWQNTLRSELEHTGVRVELTNYGYFDLFRFLIPIRFIRESAVDRVWTSVRDVRRLYPSAKVSFLAHSFGTFIVANILRKEFDFRAFRVVFCGSVVQYDFPFQDFSERFSSPIINEVGSNDYLPALAESVTWGYGSAGTYGFRGPRVRDRWHNNFGHSRFLTQEFCKRYWVPFFADGTVVEAEIEFVPPPLYIRLISRVKLRYLLIILIGLLIFFAGTRPSDSVPPEGSYQQTCQDIKFSRSIFSQSLLVANCRRINGALVPASLQNISNCKPDSIQNFDGKLVCEIK